MIEINPNYFDLPENYFFSEIEKKVASSFRKDLINLGIGDAVRPLFSEVVFKLRKCAFLMSNRKTFKGYPPVNGYDFFKEAVAEKYRKIGVKLNIDDVFVSDGAKTDIFSLLHVFGKTDALIHNPCYPAYLDANVAFGNNVEFIPSNKENSFLPMPDEIPEIFKNKRALIYLCSPDNPTGAVYDLASLSSWVKYANESGSVILFDSAYSDYIRGDYPKSIFQIENADNCAIEISSLSKSANFTGVRVGWTIIGKNLKIGGVKLNKVFSRMKASMTNGVSFIGQYIGAAALSKTGLKKCRRNTDYYLGNAKSLKKFLCEKGIYAVGGDDSPYVFFQCPKGFTSRGYSDFLLSEAGIVTAPGSGFNTGGEGYIRLSGFCTREEAKIAAKRLNKVIGTDYVNLKQIIR